MRVPKGDLHNHAFLGGNREVVSEWTGSGKPPFRLGTNLGCGGVFKASPAARGVRARILIDGATVQA